MTAIQEKVMSVEQYIQYELQSDVRHEYINGQLFEMPGEKRINNRISFFLAAYFLSLANRSYNVYGHDIKVKIPNEQKYYYPDLLLTAEPELAADEYIVFQPELVIEIISKTSRTRDTVDKYLDYIKIPSLKYYLIIDPETPYVVVHQKNEMGEWEADAYSSTEASIPLPLLSINMPMNVVYK
jgi:Uma2 family endonuclease